ncbi:MAG: hypothetical protein LBV34_01965 [Nocardiopsaceae bacterium]|nr:hypothetical protein [Nocardiopsaceae bacterium]
MTVVISPSDKPAIVAVRGKPGFTEGSSEHAVFMSEIVIAPHTRVFTVKPLAAGNYVMQTWQYGLSSTVRFIVR